MRRHVGGSMAFSVPSSLRIVLKSSVSFRLPLATACGFGVMLVGPALANPLGGAVSTGAASISTSSNKTNVNQRSEDVVIDWSSFNIGSGQTTQFVQPNAQAIAVNRVGGANASQILGALDANGRVVLINGNGVLFGKGAQVNVGSLIATSTDGSDSDVLSGKFTQAGKQNASVINNGAIAAASGGVVALVAPNVTNTGTVNAKLGTVALGAANKFTVDFTGDDLVSFAAQGDVNARASAINSGLLSGANVSMTAHAANGIATGIVNMSGIILAQGVQNVGGTIYLNAGNGTLTTTGTLNAPGTTGGGQIETSGHVANISGHITAGQGGQWKVDPEDLTIDSAAATTIDGALNGGTSVLEQTTSGAANGTGNQTPGNGDIFIDSALSWRTSATLTLDAYRDIDINSSITAPDGGLILNAASAICAGAAVDIGQFKLQAGAWEQNTASLPGFSATDFTLSGGSFLRVTGGDGSDTPYQIADVYGLQGIGSSEALLSASYVLANDIDASGTSGWNSGGGFAPIGITDTFNGTFDGQGHTISNLTINLPSAEFVGLFGGSSGTIENVGLIGGSVSGSTFVGALVGFDAGSIYNSYAATAVNGSAGGSYVGGLVGDNLETITNSYATGAVSGGAGSSYVGGLVGQNDVEGTIADSYATGTVSGGSYVGGFVGQNFIAANIDQSYETGAVSGGSYVGGFAGYNAGELGHTTADYFNSTANNGSGVGGGAGFSRGGGLLFAAMQTASNFSGWTFGTTGGASGWVIVDQNGTLNNSASAAGGTTPMLLTEYSTTIENAHQLELINLDPSANYTLANNIDATGTAGGDVWGSQGFLPIGSYNTFTGIFDGQGHTISNLTINLPSAEFVGLFGGSSGMIENVGLIGGSVSGSTFVGALVGFDAGSIYNSYAATAVNGSAGGSYVGGLVGDNLETITNSYATGAVSGGAGSSYVGGLVGQNDVEGTIADSYATGTVSGGSYVGGFVGQNFIAANIDQSYETGAVSGGSDVGGFVGYNGGELGYTTADYFNSTANNGSGVGGGAGFSRGGGLLFAAMQTASNFSGWTFGTTGGASGWVIVDQNGTLNNSASAAGGTTPMLLTEYSTTIENAHQLQLIALDESASYTLGADIDASGTAGGAVWGSQGFVPLGDYNTFTGIFDGQGHTISNLTINLPSSSGVGLFGASAGMIENVGLIGGSVSGSSLVGALVGFDAGSIYNSYAATAVSGGSGSYYVGGLVGYLDNGSVSASFATGAVSAVYEVGGLVGESEEGAISNSYAMGSVSGSSQVGGLVGALFDPSSSVTDSYSIGRVTGSTAVGGLVGLESDTGGVTDSYWDTETSGQSSGGTGAVPLTTAQMQGTFANMPGFAGPTWATSAGLFPYLSWQYASTPQAISGIAYSNGGGTVLQGGTVSTLVDGTALGTASTGANGYYYLLVVPGTITDNNNAVLAYSSANGARVDTATDALDTNNNVSGFDVWGATLIAPTSDTTYSTASATSLQTQDAALIAQAVGSNTDPTAGLTNYGYIATGASFVIDEPLTLSNGLYVKTTSGNIGVDDALTLPGSVGLALDSFGALTVDAPISVTGAGAVILDAGYDTTTVPGNAVLELSFGSGDNIAYAVGTGEGISGQSLTIDGAPYTLVYSTTDLQNINNNLNGDYALANAFDASSVSNWVPLGVDSGGTIQNSGGGFNGIFEGLGNTISNFSLDLPGVEYVGLFGFAGGASTIRDLTLSGGSVTGNGDAEMGALAGEADGVVDNALSNLAVNGAGDDVGGLVGAGQFDSTEIANSSSSGTVTATDDADAGGLVGYMQGTIVSSHATGSVSAGNGTDIGGLVGYASEEIEGSYATGNVSAGDDTNIGGLAGYTASGIENSYAAGSVSAGQNADAGGLAGYASSAVTGSHATGSVTIGSELDVGGLLGYAAANVQNSYATGNVTATGTNSDVGGLTGYNAGGIANSYATGLVSAGSGAWVGGLSGYSSGSVMESYATGGAAGGSNSEVGGLVGGNSSSIEEAYATGAVGGTGAADVGGLAGVNEFGGTIAQTYATGYVVPGSGTSVGGLVGDDVANAGSITHSYWDMNTTGIGSTQGAGNVTNDSGIRGMTTANLQGTLPTGFDNAVWSTGTGLYPYLSWQFSGTPQAVAGFTVASGGKTDVAGLDVALLVNGTSVTPAIATSSGADGYYYLLLAPGTISNSGSPLFAYLTNGTPGNSYVGNALGRDGNLEIEEGQLRVKSGASSVTGLFRALDTAVGSNTGADFLYTSADGFTPNTNLFLADFAATFNVNAALEVGTGTLWLYDPNGAISESGGGTITAGLLRGTAKNGVTLDGANEIAALGGLTNTGSGGTSLTDGETLTVRGALNTGAGALSLTTTNGENIALDGSLTTGGTLTLISAGSIWQDASSSVITANTLTGSSSGATRLQGANALTNLGAFTNTAGNFYLTNAQTLTVDGTVNAGSKVMSLNTTNGDLVDSGALHANTVTLVSSLGEVYGTGNINAMLLNVSADTGIDLDGTSNNIHRIGTRTTNSGPNVINAHNAGD